MRTPAGPVREKLKMYNLRLPHQPRGLVYTYQFADFLATQLKGDEILLEFFLMDIENAFEALRRGTDASGVPIRHDAADRVPSAEQFIRMDLPAVFRIIFPADFAEEAVRVYAEVMAEAKRKSREAKT